jgi:uncharacterized RDD family membrane protein YckC
MSEVEKLNLEGLKPASLTKRIIAMSIDDLLLYFLIVLAFYPSLASAKTYEELVLVTDKLFVYILIIYTLYHWIFVALYGKTIGKMAMKIKVVDIQILDKPSFSRALIRSIVRNFDEMFFYLGMAYAFVDPLNRAIHDIVGKAVVVEDN